jgi:hypothetical protein
VTIYFLHTPASPDRPLQALTLAELAELIGCALEAGDRIERLAATDFTTRAMRPLQHGETRRLVQLLIR